jgi:RNA 2',3'-cyclic 3'-phosphodiesterase
MQSAEGNILKSKRTFVAIRISMIDYFETMLKSLCKDFISEQILWNRTDNFHVTLFFIGDTSPEILNSIKESLDKVAQETNPFHFFISGIGVFRKLRHPRVLWLGLRETGKLYDLKVSIDEILYPILKSEAREQFKPHLTIGRIKKIKDQEQLEIILKKYENLDFIEVKVKDFIFYESIITPQGPIYEILSIHPLK